MNNHVLILSIRSRSGCVLTCDWECSLGAPPYNSAIVGGSAGTTLVNATSAAGNTCSQESLVVNITEEW